MGTLAVAELLRVAPRHIGLGKRCAEWFEGPYHLRGEILKRLMKRTGNEGKKTAELAKHEFGNLEGLRALGKIRGNGHASAADMADLELTPGAILLIAKAMNTDLEGVPVQYSISRFAADRVQFTIEN